MAIPRKYNAVILNVLLAVVICLAVNFSYLLAIREQADRDMRMTSWLPEGEDIPHTGVLHVSHDGYGYILCNAPGYTSHDPADHHHSHTDSIYVVSRLIRRLSLEDGSTLTVMARDSRNPEANSLMWKVMEIDGVPFDYGELYDNPREDSVMALQWGFYLVFAFVLLSTMTVGAARDVSMRFYLTRAAWCIVFAVSMWLLLPILRPRSGELIITAMDLPRFYHTDVMKCSFLLVSVLLYGRIYQLINQREGIMLENERLKNENLIARYNTLVNQINPHFLFNSLNSLSALVREGKTDDAVTYIDRLSDTFRYTIRNEPHTTTTLERELEFVAAYKYLLGVRYDEKLRIDISVEESKLGRLLPTFSIQPLIENAVKHNTISRAKPLRVSIRTEGDRLVVSNPINPKLEPERGTGIGLANLSHRWLLLTGRDIEIRDDGTEFSVALPFIEPNA
ncbi:MAG: histidine kinase [Alistipes sp.]|jgi:hypothetical protein|nr:histidine kinase [Alistipes sp.]